MADGLTFDELEAAGLCDCGQPLATHTPLPKPGPLTSWKASRTRDEASLSRMKDAKEKNTVWNRAFKTPKTKGE